MSGEDKAQAFFESKPTSLEAFESLKLYINDFCPEARIAIQDSLIAFKTSAGFAYISLPSDGDQSVLFTLAVTNRKKISSTRIDKVVQPIDNSPYVYHISIRSVEDIDSELKSWVRQSYEYSRLNYLRRA